MFFSLKDRGDMVRLPWIPYPHPCLCYTRWTVSHRLYVYCW